MNAIRKTLLAVVLSTLALAATTASAQKVKVGYDKSTNFSKYTTYTWAEPAMPPQRPNVYSGIVARVDEQLEAKGYKRASSNGDLTIMPAGGIDYGLSGGPSTPFTPSYGGPPPSQNATMWTGASGPSTAGTIVPEGTLVLTFVDRATNTVIWSGSVKQKLDIEQKDKSLDLIDKGVIKLLKQFPERKQ